MLVADASATEDLVQVADADARSAAARAGVRIAEADDEAASRLISSAGDLVWGPRGTFAPNELRALAFSGNPVHLATDDRDGAVVGFAVGFVGWAPALHVHSHQVGVVENRRRRGVGFALKLAQRRTCLIRGITEMRWTFDPLVRRNVAFNVNALGARAVAFYPHFYGAMADTINAGDASDRLEASWDLTRPLPAAPPAGSGTGPAVLVDDGGWPVLTAPLAPGGLVEVPRDYEAVRATDRRRSEAWRLAVRDVLARAYPAGLRVGSVEVTGYRLVEAAGSEGSSGPGSP